MDFGLKNKKVLVVGASKNIGAAIAQALAAEGGQVTVMARDEVKLRKLVAKMGGAKKGHHFVAADLLADGAPTKTIQQLLTAYDNFDIVVHNIGGALGLKDPLGKVEDWLRVWQFNVGIAVEINRLLIPAMIRKGWGRIIHISSAAATNGELLSKDGGALPYAAAKAYLNAYVKGLGRDLACCNIVVSALLPGLVLSEGKYWHKMKQKDSKKVAKFIKQRCSLGRFGQPQEIAPFAVLLASQQATFAAGSLIPIDGGIM